MICKNCNSPIRDGVNFCTACGWKVENVEETKMDDVLKTSQEIELKDEKIITKEEFENYPKKNIITRAIGVKTDVEADIYEYRLKKGDIILMCTDGLSNMVEDEDMFDIVKGARDIVEAVEMLIEKANSNGGRDNIGVVMAEPLADEVSIW